MSFVERFFTMYHYLGGSSPLLEVSLRMHVGVPSTGGGRGGGGGGSPPTSLDSHLM